MTRPTAHLPPLDVALLARTGSLTVDPTKGVEFVRTPRRSGPPLGMIAGAFLIAAVVAVVAWFPLIFQR